MGSLVSQYPLCLAWSHYGLLTCLVWARCSCGIRHAWCGLVTVFSYALHGLVVLIGGGGHSAISWVERGGSVERDNTPFNSLVLQNFSLHALLHVIPPPWGFHLSHPPNRKSHPREKSNQKSKMCATKDKARGGIGQVTGKKRKFLQNWSTPSSHPLFVSSWFEGTKVRLR